MRILIIEDDAAAASYIAKGLSQHGHVVDCEGDGTRGLVAALDGRYDALVVDRMLPGLDGLSLIEALRRSGRTTPVLILSALDRVDERVKGLRAGGDDYLTKPFAFSELLARLEVIARRGGSAPAPTELVVGDLRLDLMARTAHRAGQQIPLQPREFQILEVLMRHAGRIVTRTMLLEAVWNYRFDPQTNVIDVHISRLRQKIDKGFDRPMLQTVRGVGYRLHAPQ